MADEGEEGRFGEFVSSEIDEEILLIVSPGEIAGCSQFPISQIRFNVRAKLGQQFHLYTLMMLFSVAHSFQNSSFAGIRMILPQTSRKEKPEMSMRRARRDDDRPSNEY